MLLSEMAIMDLRVRRKSLLAVLQCWFRSSRAVASRQEESALALLPRPIPESELTGGELSGEYRWRRHPQLLRNPVSSLPDDERRARKIAVQGLYCAHNGEIDEAFILFTESLAKCAIDLTKLPTFWQMPRAALLAIVDVYEQAGQLREASTLRARIRTELRPRIVVPLPRVSDDEPRQRSVGGD